MGKSHILRYYSSIYQEEKVIKLFGSYFKKCLIMAIYWLSSLN